MPASFLKDESRLAALRTQHPLAFGCFESCSAPEAEPDYRCLDRTRNSELHIGRGPHNDLILPDPHISWCHCTLTYIEERHGPIIVKVTAKRTTNGTFINGVRLKAGCTRSLIDGDTISFGVYKMPLPKNRLWDHLSADDTLEGRGLLSERHKFHRARWQFKVHIFGPDDDASLNHAGRVVRTAWEGIIRCNDGIRTARSVLSRLRGEEYSTDTRIASAEGGEPFRRPTTPVFSPPPDEYDDTGRGFKANYLNGEHYFRLVEDRDALALYHPDIVWLGDVHCKPDSMVYKSSLPYHFQYWSSVYGLPQGLHPRWAEYSSAVYGDDCPDVGHESVLPQDLPALPDTVAEMLTMDEEQLRLKYGLTPDVREALARQYEHYRWVDATGKPIKMATKSQSHDCPPIDTPTSEPAAAAVPQPPSSLHSSKKRALDTDDDLHSLRSAACDTVPTAVHEPPRKRAKRDARTKREPTRKHAVTGSNIAQPSASIALTEVSRFSKRARPDDEEHGEERPAKRVTRATTVAHAAAAPRPQKRRQIERGDGDSVQERPAKRTARAANNAPTAATDTGPRPLKRQCTDFDDEEPAPNRPATRKTRAVAHTHAPARPQRLELNGKESLQPQERPAKRITRAASNAPSTMVDGTSLPVNPRRQRATDTVASVDTSEADDANTRRSTRLKSKKAPTRRYR